MSLNLQSIKRDVAQLSLLYDQSMRRHITIGDNGKLTIHLPSGADKVFLPEPTAAQFLADDSFVRLTLGCIRSGKSTASCVDIVRRACQMTRCKDGVRRCLTAVVRNTYPELETTTVRTWQNWFGELGVVQTRFDSPIQFKHTFNDGYGIVELTVWFLALDKDKDVRKLLSMEVTNAYWNEVREAPFSVFEILLSRVGQYPSRNDLVDDGYWYGVWADTNPPDTDCWVYKRFYSEPIEGYKIFTQPPGVILNESGKYITNPAAENIENLPNDYYGKLAQGATQEFIKVYLKGEYGSVFDGLPVYSNYNDSLHAIENIELNKNAEIYVGWDFGLTPAAVIMEFDGLTIKCLKEFVTDRAYFSELIDIVLPWVNSNFGGRRIKHIPDPAGDTPSYTDGMTGFKMLEQQGCVVIKLDGKDYRIEPRVGSVDGFLRRLSGGRPCFQVSKTGCPMLRKGFLGKYHYRKIRVSGEERTNYEPEKNHPFSDIHDCVQGVCVYLLCKDEKAQQKEAAYREGLKDNSATISNFYVELQKKRRKTLWE